MLPQQGHPQQGHPQQGGYPQQGYPPQQGGYPPQGYPPQQGGYPPQQGGYPPQQQLQTPGAKKLSGYERINKEGLYIKQKVDIAEIASGCERQNSYFIYNVGKDAEKSGIEILKAKEESNFCARQFLAANCRPFKIHIQLRDNDLKVHNTPFLLLERPCTCTLYCFGRPVVKVSHVEDGKTTYLGKIEHPWKFCNCDFNLEVSNASDSLIYKIVAKCCQTGILYGQYPCDPCQTVNFAVNSAGGMNVGALQKRNAGICASLTSLADNFAITFPINATVEEKALLLAATIFADFQWFEKRVGCSTV